MSLKILLLAFILMLTHTITSFAQTENMRVIAKLQDRAPDATVMVTLNHPSINSKSEVSFLTTDGSNPKLIVAKDAFGSPKTDIVVQGGTPVLDIDNAKLVRMLFPKMNNVGDILFTGSITTLPIDGGLFLFSQGQVRPVALVGQPTPIGGIYTGDLAVTAQFSINNNGDAVFLTNRATSDILAAIFLAKKGEKVRSIVFDGEEVPGIGKIEFSAVSPGINDNGDVLFSATTGIYMFSGGQIRKVVGIGDPSPDGGVFERVASPGNYLNNKGEVLFQARSNSRDGIYLFSPDSGITKIVADGDPAPDGATFRSLGIALTPAHGRLTNNSSFVFRGATTKTIYGLFYYSKGNILKVVGQREPTPLGGVFAEEAIFNAAFLGSIISDKDEVVFEATIKGGSVSKALIGWSANVAVASITSAIYDQKAKLLQVKASNVKSDTKVEINGKLITQPIKLLSDTDFSIKGNRKKLNLNKEVNTNKLVLISSGGGRSEAFTF